ncbi:MAG: methylated-DNA--[Firmicutes bacterium]|nr:methylated-DNA--[protein]-cysteine S-methyltransferase [Bacillota bacterium]
MKKTLYFKCPVGFVKVCGENDYLTEIKLTDFEEESSDDITEEMKKCRLQIEEYFEGKRKDFDLNLRFEGTEFRKKVWQALLDIPYGKTASYKDIAVMIESPKAVRAVGGANHNNPFWIVVPCHRIIGSDGSLTGYGGGIDKKKFLLELENAL